MTTLDDIVFVCEELASTTKRSLKISRLARFLKKISSDEITASVNFIIGKPFRESGIGPLEVGGATLYKIKNQRGQTSLTSSQLTVKMLASIFHGMSNMRGVRAKVKRERLLLSLLSQASSLEREYITRSILGDMRIGVVEGLMEEALAKASNIPLQLIKRAYTLTGDLGVIAKKALTDGFDSLNSIGLQLFQPIKPMLAETSYDIEEVLKSHKGKTVLEYKYDGVRVQIHVSGKRVRIFSRRLTDLTASIPEVVETVLDNVRSEKCLLDGEVMAIDFRGRPLPFQEVMRRLRRVHHVHEAVKQIPLQLCIFDIIFLDSHLLLDEPYYKRRSLLERIAPQMILADNLITSKIDQAKKYLKTALKLGHEGVIAKNPEGRYEPGVRGNNWIKIKPFKTLDTVIVAAEWGHGRRSGWLSNYHLAVRDERGGYTVIGKTFKGLTDREFTELTENLLQLKIGEERGIVIVTPSLVVEVAYNELQKSHKYTSGYALRFARIQCMRWEKSAEEVDSIDEVKKRYESQFKYKGRI